MRKQIIVAFDFADKKVALSLLEQLDPDKCRIKIGKEMFTRFGPDLVKELVRQGYDVFLDLKFHDIPHTVAKACQAAADLGVWMIDVHAAGGPDMLEAASQSLLSYGEQRPKLIAVTVLTSFNQQQLHAIGYDCPIEAQVRLYAALADQAGCDGVVCSPWEAARVKQNFSSLLTVTPGIRLNRQSADDQSRIMTPYQAISAGCDYLVIGRPITQAEKPLEILNQIMQQIESVNN